MDKEKFDRIQEIIKRNVKARDEAKQTYLFSGLLKCPHCGCNLAGLKRTDKRTPGNVKIHLYYRCPKHGRSNLCDFSAVFYQAPIERRLLENIESILQDQKAKANSIVKNNEKISDKYDIKELQDELERLNYSWKKGRIKAEKYDKDYEELVAKIEEATKEHQEEVPFDFSKVEKILSGNWKEIYNALDAPHRKAFWRSFIKSIEIDKNRHFTKVNFF